VSRKGITEKAQVKASHAATAGREMGFQGSSKKDCKYSSMPETDSMKHVVKLGGYERAWIPGMERPTLSQPLFIRIKAVAWTALFLLQCSEAS
jgi:hypothetical protein